MATLTVSAHRFNFSDGLSIDTILLRERGVEGKGPADITLSVDQARRLVEVINEKLANPPKGESVDYPSIAASKAEQTVVY